MAHKVVHRWAPETADPVSAVSIIRRSHPLPVDRLKKADRKVFLLKTGRYTHSRL